MERPLFQIKDLVCSYGESTGIALKVPNLTIPAGKLVFLVGPSGAGKSTLLETLGLMNDTIRSGEVLLYPGKERSPIDLNALWKRNDHSELTSIRKDHYSFIFQNTNLMENFTAYENVCLSGMIKQNINQESVMKEARELMVKVKLPENEVGLSTMAGNLSGGQRQRLAFVRALNTPAAVLFGDEPTGNLDTVNANELFDLIKNNLGDQKSAIVVSHDIELAVKYADMIIVISKDPANGYGEIRSSDVYHRADWENNEKAAFVQRLRSTFNTGKEQVQNTNNNGSTVNLKTTYRSLFYRKEGKALLGKRKSNLTVLSSIMFFTFLAIGFANGSLDYLDKKMNSAFVNWISIPIPWAKDERAVDQILQKLKEGKNRTYYAYQNISPYVKNPMQVYDFSIKRSFLIEGRTIDVVLDKKLLDEFVLNDKNLIHGSKRGFRHDNDISVIVTSKILKDMHYPPDADFIYWEDIVSDTSMPLGQQTVKVLIPVPIRAIVNELPGRYNFIYTEYFFKSIMRDKGKVFNPNGQTQYLYGFIKNADSAEIQNIRKTIADFTVKYKIAGDTNGIIIEKPLFKKDTPAIHGGYTFEIDFFKNNDYRNLNAFWDALMSDPSSAAFRKNMLRIYDFGMASDANIYPPYDQVSVYFTSLDRVKEFSEFIKSMNEDGESEKSRIEIDITKIKEKENFNFLSKVTWIISLLLIIFSSVAICLFIYNLLKMHLVKVSMNLGTFKALGLGENEARNIYFKIILGFIVFTSLIALLIAFTSGVLLDLYLSRNLTVEENIRYFKLFDWITVLTLGIILFTSVLVSWITINKIISKTPGDLIYNR